MKTVVLMVVVALVRAVEELVIVVLLQVKVVLALVQDVFNVCSVKGFVVLVFAAMLLHSSMLIKWSLNGTTEWYWIHRFPIIEFMFL